MNRLIAAAVAQASNLGSERGPFPDDNVFLIVRGQGARLADAETLAETATASPRKLLRNNGSTVTQIVKSVRPAVRPNPAQNATFDGGARLLTLKSFLTANAIRSTNSMTGVEWCSSNNSTPCALGQIGVPLLVSAMGGNTGLRDNEWLYEDGRQPRQGLLRPRRRHPQHRPLRRVRDAQGRVRQQRQELLQLRARLDERTVLALTDGRAGECYCFRSEICAAVGKSAGTFCVTAPVAAHSVPRWSDTM